MGWFSTLFSAPLTFHLARRKWTGKASSAGTRKPHGGWLTRLHSVSQMQRVQAQFSVVNGSEDS